MNMIIPIRPIEILSPLRRRLLLGMAASAGAGLLPNAWARSAPAMKEGRLIVVFLRGAYDGLSATIPYNDADYYRERPTISLPRPDGSDQASIKLDATFALHPALAPLLPFWRNGSLTFIPACGSPDPTRSHFEAQTHWELGMPGKSNGPQGWLNALADSARGGDRVVTAIGVGDANPKIMSGPAPVRLIPKGKAATKEGALGDSRTRQALLDLYAGGDQISQTFMQGADSRLSSARELAAEEQAAAGGSSVAGLPQDARHLGTLMRNDRTLRLGFLSAGGWDTHANQGAVAGWLAKNFSNLASALVQLRTDFSEAGDVITVISEFGRTCAENGTRGTDHGHGNTLWLMGNKINGGRWHGTWTGMASGERYEGRDLPVHQDFRSIFATILHNGFGLGESRLQEIFPGSRFDNKLDRLIGK
jgi:uncharacterized protein (DUF1501 family)